MSVEAGARLAKLFNQETTSSACRFGQVLEAGRGTLRISCDGLQLELEDIWINPQLSFQWDFDNGNVNYLRKGDRVLLLTLDDQDYYLISKGVRAK